MNKGTINFDEVYPKQGGGNAIIAADKVNDLFNHYVKQFNFAKETTVSIEALKQNEIEGLELMRDNKNPEYVPITPDGINLHPLFFQGWQSAILGKVFILPDCFKHCPEIKEQITAKYNETGTPPGYFENFAQLSYIEVINGWACSKFYHWLKEGQQQPTTQTQETEPPPQETTAGKIKRILTEGLTGIFEDDKHIDTITAGLIEYHEGNNCTIEPSRLFATYTDINEFYEPFVKVWKQTGLSPANIGEVLTRFVFMHNGKREGIAPGTVRKNIYECSKKLEQRNRQ